MSDAPFRLRLAHALGEIQNPARNAMNPHLKKSYTDLAGVINAGKEILANHDLFVIQPVDYRIVEGVWHHAIHTIIGDGHSEEFVESFTLCPATSADGGLNRDGQPIKNNLNHESGIVITYHRRYALAAILGIASEDDDDGGAPRAAQATTSVAPRAAQPGSASSAEAVVSVEQQAQIRQAAEARGMTTPAGKLDFAQLGAVLRPITGTTMLKEAPAARFAEIILALMPETPAAEGIGDLGDPNAKRISAAELNALKVECRGIVAASLAADAQTVLGVIKDAVGTSKIEDLTPEQLAVVYKAFEQNGWGVPFG